jgi:NDP-4-keto-2,6-dideoxyhexose 3-C-methyltransferase
MADDPVTTAQAPAPGPVALITEIRGQDGWYLARRLLALGYRVIGTTHEATRAGVLAIDGHDVPVIALDLADAAQIEDAIRGGGPTQSTTSRRARRACSCSTTAGDGRHQRRRGRPLVSRRSAATTPRRGSARRRAARCRRRRRARRTRPARVPINAYGSQRRRRSPRRAYRRSCGCSRARRSCIRTSPRRPVHFLVRKVAHAAAAIAAGRDHAIALGDLDAVRDWAAPDAVEAMRRMLQQREPRDYVIATGEAHTVRDVCDAAFGHVGLDWRATSRRRPAGARRRRGRPARQPRARPRRAGLGAVAHLLRADRAYCRFRSPPARDRGANMTTPLYRRIDRCRVCGNPQLEPLVDLGEQALTGVFPRRIDQRVPSGPLALVKCHGAGRCGLVQLLDSYAAEEMYGDNYGYRSGLNASMVHHLRGKIARILSRVAPPPGALVLDIGSNDGTTLAAYPDGRFHRLGIDPTAAKFRQHYPPDVQLWCDLFSERVLAPRTGGSPGTIVTSFCDVHDLGSAQRSCASSTAVLADDGIWVFEQSYLPLISSATPTTRSATSTARQLCSAQIAWMARAHRVQGDRHRAQRHQRRQLLGRGRPGDERARRDPELARIPAEERAPATRARVYAAFARRVADSRAALRSFLAGARAAGRRRGARRVDQGQRDPAVLRADRRRHRRDRRGQRGEVRRLHAGHAHPDLPGGRADRARARLPDRAAVALPRHLRGQARPAARRDAPGVSTARPRGRVAVRVAEALHWFGEGERLAWRSLRAGTLGKAGLRPAVGAFVRPLTAPSRYPEYGVCSTCARQRRPRRPGVVAARSARQAVLAAAGGAQPYDRIRDRHLAACDRRAEARAAAWMPLRRRGSGSASPTRASRCPVRCVRPADGSPARSRCR